VRRLVVPHQPLSFRAMKQRRLDKFAATMALDGCLCRPCLGVIEGETT